MKILSLSIIIIIILIGITTGCAFFTSPKEQPVQQDVVGPFFGEKSTHVFSLTPERRIVIVMPHKAKNVQFCAEPPPDVAENLADTMRLLAEAQAKDSKMDVKASAEFYKAFTSSSMSLFYRSQGVQLFRDGLYNLCQAYINKMIEDKEYAVKYTELLDTAAKLIEDEIPKIQTVKAQEAAERAAAAEIAAKAASGEAQIFKEAAETAAQKAEKLVKEAKREENSE